MYAATSQKRAFLLTFAFVMMWINARLLIRIAPAAHPPPAPCRRFVRPHLLQDGVPGHSEKMTIRFCSVTARRRSSRRSGSGGARRRRTTEHGRRTAGGGRALRRSSRRCRRGGGAAGRRAAPGRGCARRTPGRRGRRSRRRRGPSTGRSVLHLLGELHELRELGRALGPAGAEVVGVGAHVIDRSLRGVTRQIHGQAVSGPASQASWSRRRPSRFRGAESPGSPRRRCSGARPPRRRGGRRSGSGRRSPRCPGRGG